jgi:type IV pilus assembly protein PilE
MMFAKMKQGNYRTSKGFSLIELMVALGIVGILSAVAYPSYTSYILRTNRADAKAIMMESAQFMERYYSTNNTYVGAVLFSTVVPKGAVGSRIKYNLSYQTGEPTATTFVLQAIPTTAQASDSCGTLTLSQTGAQTPTTAGCW